MDVEKYIDIVFDGPPGPEGGRFVEAENEEGKSIIAGEWINRADGFWSLRMRPISNLEARIAAARKLAKCDYPYQPRGFCMCKPCQIVAALDGVKLEGAAS
jgi:hypothetical protein